MTLARTGAVSVILGSLIACSSHNTETNVPEVAQANDAAATETAKAPVIDADADNAVRAMCDALSASSQFSLRVEANFDQVMEDDQPVESSATSRVVVRRPDGLFVDRIGERGHRMLRYDGKSRVCGILDVDRKLYAQGTAPPTVEETLDALHDVFGMTIPLADFAVNDPYGALNTGALSGVYVGEHSVRGTPCHHVAYSNAAIDWQIWIQATGDPVPRRFAISYKRVPGAPRFSAYLDNWNLRDTSAATEFEFKPPEGSRRIYMVPKNPVASIGGGK
jgi:hypothetical protein